MPTKKRILNTMSNPDYENIENPDDDLDALISNVSSADDLEVDFKTLGGSKLVKSEEYISMFDIIRAKNAAAAKKDLPSQPSQITLSSSNKKRYTLSSSDIKRITKLKNTISSVFVITLIALYAFAQLTPTKIIDSPNIKNEAIIQNETKTQNEANTQKEVATPPLSTTFETEFNDQDKKQLLEASYQEANQFIKDITVITANNTGQDALKKALQSWQEWGKGGVLCSNPPICPSYSNGIYTSSYGVSYNIKFNGETITLGEIFSTDDAKAWYQARHFIGAMSSVTYTALKNKTDIEPDGIFSQASVTELKIEKPNTDWSINPSLPSDRFLANTISIFASYEPSANSPIDSPNIKVVAAIRGATTDDIYYNCWFAKKSSIGEFVVTVSYALAIEKRTEIECTATNPPNDENFRLIYFPPAP